MARHHRSRAFSSLTAPILALLAGVGFVVQAAGVAGEATGRFGPAPVATDRVPAGGGLAGGSLAGGVPAGGVPAGALRAGGVLAAEPVAAPGSGGRVRYDPVIDPALPVAAGAPRPGALRILEGTGSGPTLDASSDGSGGSAPAAGPPSMSRPSSAAAPQGTARAALVRAGRLAAPATGPPVLPV